MTDDFAILLAALPQILLVGGIFFAIHLTIKKGLDPLIKEFKSEAAPPPELHRVGQFKYAKGVKINNGVKIAEQNGELFLKAMFMPPLRIPLNELAHVEEYHYWPNMLGLRISFKDKSLQSMDISFKSGLAAQLPRLMQMAEKSDASKTNTATEKVFTFRTKRSSSNHAIPASVNTNELKGKASNWLRSALLIALVIAFLFGLLASGY